MSDFHDSIRVNSLSVHVRYASLTSLVDAVARLGIARNAPVAVWPPRRLPYGLFVSPVRNGWISLWSPLEDVREWFPKLTASLECPGVLLQVIESKFWIAEFLQDGDLLGRVELPTEAVRYDNLWALTVDSLEAEGVSQPWEDEERFGQRLDEVARSEEHLDDLRQMQEERPAPEALRAFLPPHASVERAWDLLFAIDHAHEDAELDAETYAEDAMEAFAGYLGIRDASWDPREDAEALSHGEYEDEGLPEGWREFLVLPVVQLPVLDG
jgi:hypothetical protein